jgi:kumamolisin
MSSSDKKIEKVPIPGSKRVVLPGAQRVGAANPNEVIEVTVIVRPSASSKASAIAQETSSQALGQRKYLTREEFAAAHGASVQDLEEVKKFAQEYGLQVIEVNPAQRIVKLSGSVDSFTKAFEIKLDRFEHPQGAYRGREGEIFIPKAISDIVKSVHGLDNRPQLQPRFHRLERGTKQQTTQTQPRITTRDIATAYNLPTRLTGWRSCIGIIEFGGGFTNEDLNTYFGKLGIPTPSVSSVSVDGALNSPGDQADGEVELDIEVVGAIAPQAKIAVYFAPNSDKGFIDSLSAAIHDTQNGPSIISISWGNPECLWSDQTRTSMDQIFQDAASLGVTVFAASGDSGSSDGGAGESPVLEHVDYPASSPWVTGCGGTTLNISNGAITSETCWSGSGGGVSIYHGLPSYQAGAGVPSSPVSGKPGRGVPDVSGNADPNTGYDVVIDGAWTVEGGTSAVAPLYAGLTALWNQDLARRRTPSVGFLNPLLYAHPDAINDITGGNNDSVGHGNFRAGPGWDACTGLGSPNGTKLLKLGE